MSKVIKIYETVSQLQEAAADFILEAGRQAITATGRFTLALSGGSTPERVHELLARPERASCLDWSKTFIFVGDDRFVPFDHPSSNYGMAQRSLLNHVPIPAVNLYPMPTQLASPEAAAQAYAQTLSQFFQVPVQGPPPRLDLLLLGLGDDGHTASLFPGKPTLSVTDRWVVASPPGTLPPPVDRVTLTFPVINAGQSLLMLVTGEKKATVVREILEGNPDPNVRPAVSLRPPHGIITWMLDRGAASQLKQN